jgi:ATP/maltotriose-dependent transcriptional regulator MalT/DNA-binding SARP family transcriptional activator
MSLRDFVIQSQLVPPRSRQGILSRPRISSRLKVCLDYPLTIVQAGTGYGKSTELAALAEQVPQLYWYSVREADRDPFLFLVNLVSAFGIHGKPWGKSILDTLEEEPQSIHVDLLRPLLNDLSIGLPCETVLVLDDFHHVTEVAEIENLVTFLVDNCPQRLHVVLSTRRIPNYNALPRWRVKGLLHLLHRAELAFTREEILALFQDHFLTKLSDDQVSLLHKETEGWAIALQMVWQSLQNNSTSLEQVLAQRPYTLEALFEYLANEVLDRLQPGAQNFLVTVSVLNQIEPEICDLLMGTTNSEKMILSLQESGLFLSSVGERVFQFQNLFHDFLYSRLWANPENARNLHQRCAAYYLVMGRKEAAVYHLLEANLYLEAAAQIIESGPELIRIGRLDSLLGWITRFPTENMQESAGLLLLSGEIRRLKSDFEEALVLYTQAEKKYIQLDDHLGRSKALRGQAQIFLDTIRPLRAEALLEEALRLLEPQEYHQETAALLDQLAENKLNLGHPDQAQALHHEAQLLRVESDPGDVYLEARALMRTGHLNEARDLLSTRALEEKSTIQSRPQRFHRETLLLLSLICILQGDWQTAMQFAKDGIATGQRLNSSFVEAVGLIRLGHAYEVQSLGTRQTGLSEQAILCYEQAIEKVRMFKVTRVQVEPLWGLSRVYGLQGKLLESQTYARQAMDLAFQAGDKWLYHLVNITNGITHFYNGQTKEAMTFFMDAYNGFVQVADSYGVAACLLWKAVVYWEEGDADRAIDQMRLLLPLIKAGKYTYLLTRPTYLSVKDEQQLVPLVLETYRVGIEKQFLEQIIRQMNLDEVDFHPGYRLYVQTLGVFEVWRGGQRIRSAEWQRDKARQLLQLLLINRHEWLQRDQIVDRLWPDLTPDAAVRDFKVALNALHRALEPGRPRGVNPFFIIRRDNLYAINPQASLWLDVEEMESLIRKDDVNSLKGAIALYKGEFLSDSLYNEWTENRREQVKFLYLSACERLAELYLQEKKFDAANQVCEQLLAVEPTWEAAYRMMMEAYAGKNNRSQVIHVYHRCQEIMKMELGVEPSEVTSQVFEILGGNENTN